MGVDRHDSKIASRNALVERLLSATRQTARAARRFRVADAADLVDEVFGDACLKLVARVPDASVLRDGDAFASFVTNNAALDLVRKANRRARHETPLDDDAGRGYELRAPSLTPEEMLIDRQRHLDPASVAIRAAFEELRTESPRRARVLRLFSVVGLSADEIMKREGFPTVNAVHKTLERARNDLRRLFGRRAGDTRSPPAPSPASTAFADHLAHPHRPLQADPRVESKVCQQVKEPARRIGRPMPTRVFAPADEALEAMAVELQGRDSMQNVRFFLDGFDQVGGHGVVDGWRRVLLPGLEQRSDDQASDRQQRRRALAFAERRRREEAESHPASGRRARDPSIPQFRRRARSRPGVLTVDDAVVSELRRPEAHGVIRRSDSGEQTRQCRVEAGDAQPVERIGVVAGGSVWAEGKARPEPDRERLAARRRVQAVSKVGVKSCDLGHQPAVEVIANDIALVQRLELEQNAGQHDWNRRILPLCPSLNTYHFNRDGHAGGMNRE